MVGLSNIKDQNDPLHDLPHKGRILLFGPSFYPLNYITQTRVV